MHLWEKVSSKHKHIQSVGIWTRIKRTYMSYFTNSDFFALKLESE